MKSNDIVMFMTSFKLSNVPRLRKLYKKKTNIKKLMEKHHIDNCMFNNKLFTQSGILSIEKQYDYIKQSTKYKYNPPAEVELKDFEEDISSMDWFVKLVHAGNTLLDENYFKLNIGINYERFLVNIGSKTYQVDPLVYLINDVLYITFELIDFETGFPLRNYDIFGITNNFNILKVDTCRYFSDNTIINTNNNIPNIIFQDIICFFSDFLGYKFDESNNSWIHNIAVLTQEEIDIASYFDKVLGVKKSDSEYIDISTQSNYRYYLKEYLSLNIYFDNDFELILRDFQILESLKMYIFTERIVYNYFMDNLKDTLQEHLKLKYIISSSNMPIASVNIFKTLEETETYKRQEKALELKIKLLEIENKDRLNRNTLLLNILVYGLTFLGSIGSAEIIEEKFNIPFIIIFVFLCVVFMGLGIYWIFKEKSK